MGDAAHVESLDHEGNPDGLVKYYKDDFELIYRERTFRIDTELKSLGIESNRQLATLERLISMLNDESRAETARRLLARYTNESFRQPEQLRSWFEENKDRIYFTDVGGYKFLVVPQGYLTKK